MTCPRHIIIIVKLYTLRPQPVPLLGSDDPEYLLAIILQRRYINTAPQGIYVSYLSRAALGEMEEKKKQRSHEDIDSI